MKELIFPMKVIQYEDGEYALMEQNTEVGEEYTVIDEYHATVKVPEKKGQMVYLFKDTVRGGFVASVVDYYTHGGRKHTEFKCVGRSYIEWEE